MAAAELLGVIALVIGLGVVAELAGDRLGVPNFLFFVAVGILLGPVGLGILHHDLFGKSLAAVVGIGVAIIIFNSGRGVTVEVLRGAPPMAFVLSTVGVLVTFLGMGYATYRILDVAPGIALLIGALLVATGSTVIEPILAAVPLRERLAYTMEIEALATEVTAGILSVAVYHAITLTETEPREFAVTFAWHLLAGVLVGAAVAAVVYVLFKLPDHAPERAPRHASQLYLATAIVTFALAEQIAQEAGVAAVATAGLLLGNADIAYEEHVDTFQEELTTFIIAFLFVVLASFVEPEWLGTVGIGGLLVAGVLMALVRPAAVVLSTALSVLSIRERLFLSMASPRGIIPAGVATLLAIEIQESNPEAAATITGTVLLVIITTTLLQGVFAGRVAEELGVVSDRAVIVGGGRLGLALADQYAAQGEQVVIVETDPDTIERARNAGFAVYEGDGTDEDVLRRAGTDSATRVVAATADDDANLKVALLATQEFDVPTVLARLNYEDNRSMFKDFEVELLSGSQLDLWALDHLVAHSAPDWLAALTRSGGVKSIAVNEHRKRRVADVNELLPERVFVASLSRDGDTWVPEDDEQLQAGDRLTVLGRADAVEETVSRLGPYSELDSE
jgi:NhaP-type Na+/H+ or K+/H+ antiporter/Trk K+ transport system NAD-binding subunit